MAARPHQNNISWSKSTPNGPRRHVVGGVAQPNATTKTPKGVVGDWKKKRPRPTVMGTRPRTAPAAKADSRSQ
jgi:hypothetical protein